MSNAPTPFFRRPIYRAPSPPTWACYEQIPYSDCSESECSDDDDDDDDDERDDDDELSGSEDEQTEHVRANQSHDEVPNMDIDEAGDGASHESSAADAPAKKDLKGKQRAIDPEPAEEISPERAPRSRRKRQPTYNPRPILTIHKSQGFVWNQDLFIPPYIKDRYVASTSPPNSRGFIPGSWSSTDSVLGGYEVEVVEIRVTEGELDDILSH